MPRVTFTLEDTPTGGVAVHTDFKPAIGQPCSQAQSAALEIISRTRKDYGLTPKVPVAVVVRPQPVEEIRCSADARQ